MIWGKREPSPLCFVVRFRPFGLVVTSAQMLNAWGKRASRAFAPGKAVGAAPSRRGR